MTVAALTAPSPLVGEGGSTRSGSETDEGFVSAERTPHPPSLREGTFSHKGRRKNGCATSAQSRRVGKAKRAHHPGGVV